MVFKKKNTPWFRKKLDEQAARIAALEAQVAATSPSAPTLPVNTEPTSSGGIQTNGGTTTHSGFSIAEAQRGGLVNLDIESYARGFYDCMCKYGIFAKGARRRIVQTIKERYKGDGDVGYVWRVK